MHCPARDRSRLPNGQLRANDSGLSTDRVSRFSRRRAYHFSMSQLRSAFIRTDSPKITKVIAFKTRSLSAPTGLSAGAALLSKA
jgi:hypothetical protein